MPNHGGPRDVSLQINGESVSSFWDVMTLEDLGGSRLELTLPAEAVRGARPDQRLTLSVDGTQGFELNLWLTEIHEWHGSAMANIRAADALTICGAGRHFGSHPPGGNLAGLVQRVLSRHPSFPTGAVMPSGPSPAFGEARHLQCQETAADFLQRKAAGADCLVYPGRRGPLLGRCGAGPLDPPPQVSVRLDGDVLSARRVRSAAPPAQSATWVEPVTRDVRMGPIGHSDSQARLNHRSVEMTPPVEASAARQGRSESPVRLFLSTDLPSIALGSNLLLENWGSDWVVERIRHSISDQGLYTNEIECVPRARWGFGLNPDRSGPAGLFQAEVYANDDPSGFGRVKVVLAGDTEGRPSDWVPTLCMSAGKSSGWHWLPDAGETVMVMAEARCPENLIVLGSIRGRKQPMDPELRGLKGVRVEGDFLIVTSGGVIRLSRKGVLDIDANQRINIGGSE